MGAEYGEEEAEPSRLCLLRTDQRTGAGHLIGGGPKGAVQQSAVCGLIRHRAEWLRGLPLRRSVVRLRTLKETDDRSEVAGPDDALRCPVDDQAPQGLHQLGEGERVGVVQGEGDEPTVP